MLILTAVHKSIRSPGACTGEVGLMIYMFYVMYKTFTPFPLIPNLPKHIFTYILCTNICQMSLLTLTPKYLDQNKGKYREVK